MLGDIKNYMILLDNLQHQSLRKAEARSRAFWRRIRPYDWEIMSGNFKKNFLRSNEKM